MTLSRPLPSGIYPILDAAWLHRYLQEETWSSGDRVRLARELDTAFIRQVQLRCKDSAEHCRKFFARWIEVLRSEAAVVQVIINDHLQLTRELGADGIHVGQDDTPVAQCRTFLGPRPIIGLSTHHQTEVQSAAATVADYIGFGPIFETHSKPDTEPVCGLSTLKAAVQNSPKPVVAIGGIHLDNLFSVALHGAHAAAIISGLWDQKGVFIVGSCTQEFAKGVEYRTLNPL